MAKKLKQTFFQRHTNSQVQEKKILNLSNYQ